MTQPAPDGYRVLARKYRPSSFEQLIGQEAMVRTLANAIAAGRLAHAFLLTGVRGVGKTSTARLIAKSLNCIGLDGTGGPTIAPCGQCDACTAIAESRHIDVLEMDAASRTGVDDIREIIDSVRYAPVSARFKVYIIDEVHMLSKNAFNALLKTLEEPPPHVIFLFATTEIRKVPVTVLSRCQRFDLRRIPLDVLVAHFQRVCLAEGAEVDDQSLKLIAKAAEGSVRDGLSILDQAIAHGGGKVESSAVRDMLGLADRTRVLDIMGMLLEADAPAALAALRNQYDLGVDPAVLVGDLLEITHRITRARVAGASDDLGETERDKISQWAQHVPMPALQRLWQMLNRGMQDIHQAPSAIEAAEMLLLRVMYAATDLPDPADLLRKLQTQTTTQSRKAEPPLAQTPPLPAQFSDLVGLLERQSEGLLGKYLRDDCQLVRYAPPSLDLTVLPSAPRDFVVQLRSCLERHTGQAWTITQHTSGGEASLRVQEEEAQAALQAQVLQDPMVQAVQKHFPGAKLVSIAQRGVPIVQRDSLKR